MSQQSKPPAKPPLDDPLHAAELFVSDIAGVGFVHGVFTVTLASIRADEPVGGQQPTVRRVVVGRLALTNVAAGQLLQQLQMFAAKIEAMAASPKGKPN